jgi:hypothetical protein
VKEILLAAVTALLSVAGALAWGAAAILMAPGID